LKFPESNLYCNFADLKFICELLFVFFQLSFPFGRGGGGEVKADGMGGTSWRRNTWIDEGQRMKTREEGIKERGWKSRVEDNLGEERKPVVCRLVW
jgi:hypothetical protein